MRKKAQVAEQIFIYLLAIILAGLLLIYGYNAISGFVGRTEQISLVKFQNDITSAIKTISTDYGSVQKKEISVPSTFDMVCFIDLSPTVSKELTCLCNVNSCGEQRSQFNPLICDAWKTEQNKQNVFLVPMADVSISVAPMRIEEGYLCVPVNKGKITLRLEGLGDRAKVSRWSD